MESASAVSLLRVRYLLIGAFADLLEDGAVAWRNGEIVATGPYASVREKFPDAPCKSYPNHLVMPGLVNAHDHGRGVGTLQMGVPDEPLELWINGLFALRAVDPYLAALYDGLMLLASGVTTTTHQHNPCDWQALEQELIDVAKGYHDAGIRACIGVPLMDQNTLSYIGADAFLERLPKALSANFRGAGLPGALPPAEAMIGVGRALAKAWQDNSLHWLCWGPVGPQWCSDRLLERIIAEAGDNPVHIHASETKAQQAYGRRAYGKTPIAHLLDLDFLKSNVTCAHCVWVDEGDIDALAKSGASVAHNPSSNLRLRSGTAPVLQLLRSGVQVGLGLDGQTLNDDQDMWQEMRLARGLAFEPGITGAFLSARRVMAMATTVGAAITGGPQRGELVPGTSADMVAVRLDRLASPYLDSRTGIIDAVFGRAKPADVDAVLVGGVVRIEAGRPVGLSLDEVKARLATSLEKPKLRDQCLREAFAARLGPYLQDLYLDWK
jgi:5-methylthioadenosine/S-adenosylhomocysteine deaminase